MDLKKELLAEHSKVQAKKVADWIGDDQKRYDQLVEIFMEGHYRLNQRAAWPLTMVGEKHPEFLQKHLGRMIKRLGEPSHDAVKRNIVRTFQFMDIPEGHQGNTYNACFELLNDPNQAIAIRAFSMTVLWNIARENPDLIPELKMCIEEHLPYGSAGFKNRGGKILKAMQAYSE